MRYTLTNRAIAVLLSLILFIGSASGLVIVDEDESTFVDIIEEINTPEGNGSSGNQEEIIVDDDDTTEISNSDFKDPDNENEPADENDLMGQADLIETDGESINDREEDGQPESLSLQQSIIPYSDSRHWVTLQINNDSAGTLSIQGIEPYEPGESYYYIENNTVITIVAVLSSDAWEPDGWNVFPSGTLTPVDSEPLKWTIRVVEDIDVFINFKGQNDVVTFGILEKYSESRGDISAPTGFSFTYDPVKEIYFNNSVTRGEGFSISFNANPDASKGYLVGNWYVSDNEDGPFTSANVVQTGTNAEGLNRYTSSTRTGDTHVRVSFVQGKSVVYGVEALPGFPVGSMSATYTLDGGSTKILSTSPASAPEGANLEFTVPAAPAGLTLFAYEFRVYRIAGYEDGTPIRGALLYESIAKSTPSFSGKFLYPNVADDIVVALTLVPGYKVFFESDINGGTLSAKDEDGYAVNSGDIVKSGTDVTFTVVSDGSFGIFEYEWFVGINSDAPESEETQLYNATGTPPPGTFIFTPSKHPSPAIEEVEVSVVLYEGRTITFSASDGGVIEATNSAGDSVTSTSLQRKDADITFEVTQGPSYDVLAYLWTVNGTTTAIPPPPPAPPQNPTYSIPLAENTVVQLDFSKGFQVNFSVAGNIGGDLIATQTLDGITDDFVGGIIDERTEIVFKATPSVTPVIYRIAEWTINGASLSDSGVSYSLSSGGDELTLIPPINTSINVSVRFEEITFSLDITEVTVKGHGLNYIESTTPPIPGTTFTFGVGGNATDNITVDSSALPSGLTVTANNPTGTITISSASPLSHLSNPLSPISVNITREGVTAVLTIKLEIPFMEVLVELPEVVPLEINNSKLSITIILHTDAPAGDVIMTGLPSAFSITNSVHDGPDRTKLVITASRADLVSPIDNTLPVTLTRSGVGTTFDLYINLTPLPRVNSITPVESELTVGVNAVTAPSPILAVFNISGSNFSGNEAEVAGAFSFEAHPWINPELPISVTSITDTSAIVTIPLLIESNATGTGDRNTPNVVITTSLPNATDGNEKGELTVFQYSPIILTPKSVNITNHSPVETTVSVAGSGEIFVAMSPLSLSGALPSANVHLNFSTSEFENEIVITFTRPGVNDSDIVGTYIVRVTRDGLWEDLTINVNLTSLDRPLVTWPSGFSATFGQTLNNVSIASATTAGSARFSYDEGVTFVNVPGVFTWTTPANPVGNAGNPSAQTHSMTFTPNDTDNFASVVTTGAAGLEFRTINVARANPNVTWPVIDTDPIYFGYTLSQVQFSGGSAVNPFNSTSLTGTSFTWTDSASTSVGGVGTKSFSMTFTPTGADAANYNTASTSISITVSRAEQPPPSTPFTTSNISAVSITLNNINNDNFNAQFLIRIPADPAPVGTEWLAAISSPNLTFENLNPYTDYVIYARYPGYPDDSSFNPSPVSQWTIKTDKAALEGSVLINGIAEYGNLLTANTGALVAVPPGTNAALEGFTYQWTRSDSPIPAQNGDISGATFSTYTVGVLDIGANITVTVKAANANGEIESANFGPIAKRTPASNDLDFTTTAVTFNGSPQAFTATLNTASVANGIGAISSIQYRLTGEDTWGTAPTNVGIYDVKVTIDEGTYYSVGEVVLQGVFTINKATPTATDVVATLNSNDITTTSPVYKVDFTGSAFVPVVSPAPPPTSVIGLIQTDISVFYRFNGNTERISMANPPILPGTVDVYIDVAANDNYVAVSDIKVGQFIIDGTDIPIGDITVLYEGTDVTASGVNETYDGAAHFITIVDSGGFPYNVEYSTDGVTWSATSPQITNATIATGTTIHYRVIRTGPIGSGYNPFVSSTKITINPKQLTWATSGTVESKVYNRSVSANIITNPTLDGIIGTDNVYVVPGTAEFNNWNVGTDKPITATGTWAIGGTASGNYAAPSGFPSFNTANISAKALTISGVLATNRDYNASELVVLAGGSLNGVETGDTVGFTLGNATMANSNVGTGKAVTTVITLTGDAGNYTLTQPTGITVDIAPKALTISGVSATNRNYNGLTSVGLSGGSLSGVEAVDFDYVSFTLGSGAIATANAGGGKPVTTAIVLNGTRASNYTLTQPTGITVTIAQTPLTPSINFMGVSGKVFDNSAVIIGTQPTISLSGAVNSDVPIANATFAFAASFGFSDVDAQDNKNVSASGIALTGSWGTNYTLTTTSLSQASGVDITPRQITGSANIIATAPFGPNMSIIDGTTLTADVSSIIGVPGVLAATLSYEWYAGDVKVADGPVYVVGSTGSIGTDVEVTLKVTGTVNFWDSISSSPIVVGKTPIGGTLSMTGTPLLNNTLALSYTPDPIVAEYSIVWLRNGEVVAVVAAGNICPGYIVTRADLGKTITVEVRGTGDFTGSMSASVFVNPIVPNKPLNLTATPGDKQVTLEWNVPDCDGGNSIKKYQVSIDGGGTWVDVVPFTPFMALMFTPFDFGLFSAYSAAPDVTYVVDTLINDTEYEFRVRAVNDVDAGEHEYVMATPVAPPVITSISPTADTVALFNGIDEAGLVEQVIFDVTGTSLTEQSIMAVNAFSVSQFPAWVLPSNLQVEFINSESARVTLTLTVMQNTGEARTGNIAIANNISSAVTGSLSVSQYEVSPSEVFRVTILNSPGGASVSRQSASVRVFEAGERVSLVAGTRTGFLFDKWSTSSQGVVFDKAANAITAFIMPANDVIIIANWAEDKNEPPPVPLSEFPPEVPPDEPGVPPSHDTGGGGGTITNPGGGADSGTEDGGLSIMTDTASIISPDTGTGSVFRDWLVKNLWWILVCLGTITVLGVLWFIYWYKTKFKKKKAVFPRPVDT